MKKGKGKLLYMAVSAIICLFLSYAIFSHVFTMSHINEGKIIKRPLPRPKQQESQHKHTERKRTSYDFQMFFSSPQKLTAQQKIKYIVNGAKKQDIRILLPANLIYEEPLIKIKKIRISQKDAKYKLQEGYLDIFFLQDLKEGEEVVLFIEFEVDISRGKERFGKTKNMILLTNWYPVVAPFNEKQGDWCTFSPSRFGDPYFYESVHFSGYFLINKEWQVVSPLLTKNKEHGNKYNIYFFATKEPVRDLTFVVGKNFKCETIQKDNLEIAYYYVSPRRDIIRRAQDVLAFYEEIYGKYGLDKFLLVDVPLQNFWGTEYSGMVFLSTLKTVGARTIAHEIGHQYWYYAVGTDQLNEPWIDESLATYSSLLYLEQLYGSAYYENEIASLKKFNKSYGLGALSVYKTNKEYKDATYRRACLFWDYIRKLQGKAKLYQVLQKIQKDYKDRILYHNDLIKIINEEYKGDVTKEILDKLYATK